MADDLKAPLSTRGDQKIEDLDVWRSVLRRIRRRVRPGQDPEDLLHSAYIRLREYQKSAVVENEAAFLVRTASNLAIDDWRRGQTAGHRVNDAATAEIADLSPRQDEVLAQRVRLERVRQLIGKMSPRTREVFLLHRLEGLKYREVAARLGISQSAVEKHVARAVAFLADGAKDI